MESFGAFAARCALSAKSVVLEIILSNRRVTVDSRGGGGNLIVCWQAGHWRDCPAIWEEYSMCSPQRSQMILRSVGGIVRGHDGRIIYHPAIKK
jgi:hypothetical protein